MLTDERNITALPETVRTIYHRRATRKYLERPVARPTLEKIIDAGRMAPSAMNSQPWKFYVLTKREDIDLFSHEIRHSIGRGIPHAGIRNVLRSGLEALKHLSFGIEFLKEKDPVFHGAPVVIFITAPRRYEWAGLDVGMCSQNMMLAAKALGLESCPVGFGKFVMHAKSYQRLHIPKNEEVQLAVIVGYGDESPQVHRRKTDNATFL